MTTAGRFLKTLSMAVALVAVYFWYIGEKDFTFAAAVSACVLFFLSVRADVKKRNSERLS